MTYQIFRHIRQLDRMLWSWRITNLSLREDGQENVLGVIVGALQSNEQKRIHSVNSTRFDEHRDDGFVQSTDSNFPRCGGNAPGV